MCVCVCLFVYKWWIRILAIKMCFAIDAVAPAKEYCIGKKISLSLHLPPVCETNGKWRMSTTHSEWRLGLLFCFYFFFVVVFVDWNTDDADIKFSIYWPSTWFSERNFKFSSLTPSTRCDRSGMMKNSMPLSQTHFPISKTNPNSIYHLMYFEVRALVKWDVLFPPAHLDWCRALDLNWTHHYCTCLAMSHSILHDWCCHWNLQLWLQAKNGKKNSIFSR